MTPFGCFCYVTMPFGFKNAGATFMRMIQKCLLTQINRNVEAYMNDIVVKSRKGSDPLTDLAETFANLRRYDIKRSTRQSVRLEFQVASYSVSSFPNRESTQIRKKSVL